MTNGNAHESNFMAAADKSIKDLQVKVHEVQVALKAAQDAARAAKVSADKAAKDTDRWKFLTRCLVVVLLVTMVGTGLSIYNWARAVEATNSLRQQNIAQCRLGNSHRSAEVQVWDTFIGLLTKGDTKPGDLQAAQKFETYISTQLAQRNCVQAYGGK